MKSIKYLSPLLVSLLLLPLDSFAKSKSRAAGAAGSVLSAVGGLKIYDENTLTVAQLTQCMSLSDKMDHSSVQIEQGQLAYQKKDAALTVVRKEIDDLESYLLANEDVEMNQSEVDVYNQRYDRYEALIGEYNQGNEEYQRMLDDFNALIDPHNAIVDQFDASCEGKSYYEEDMLLVNSSK